MDAWFSADAARNFSLLSFLSLATLLIPLAHQGKAYTIVMSVAHAMTGLGVLLLGMCVAALATGQPAYVALALGLSGIVIAPVCAAGANNIHRLYRNAELRRSLAHDL